ncbi:hypothetical protein FVA95_07600 [Pseudonocardia sp. EV170527-09]|uniref:hypothetical protein n=1 Tax=Pseudonocardia sp. EV170527-09 TaxID=2603411 RepID=UPI0011F3BE18|nr:hypothetical protein [Pseudonocardia sp. EV170527-09]KAA1032572.1 hypothetical protein FVA95_07600 [Pseudonocardia sp. EV170527-09]
MHTDRHDTAGLDDCTAPLADEQREALHEFWDRVIAEEWGPAPIPRPAPVDGALVELAERRRRRSTRRAMTRMVRAAQVTAPAPSYGGEAA